MTPSISPLAALRGVALGLVVVGCDKQPREPELPPAEVFDQVGEIAGSWRGEVAGVSGRLEVEPLGSTHYRGMFEADVLVRRYVLNIERIYAASSDGGKRPSNLVRFDWQDGRGDLGSGWLLMNRDASALTGAFGRGEDVTEGAGTWTFLRADADAATLAEPRRARGDARVRGVEAPRVPEVEAPQERPPDTEAPPAEERPPTVDEPSSEPAPPD